MLERIVSHHPAFPHLAPSFLMPCELNTHYPDPDGLSPLPGRTHLLLGEAADIDAYTLAQKFLRIHHEHLKPHTDPYAFGLCDDDVYIYARGQASLKVKDNVRIPLGDNRHMLLFCDMSAVVYMQLDHKTDRDGRPYYAIVPKSFYLTLRDTDAFAPLSDSEACEIIDQHLPEHVAERGGLSLWGGTQSLTDAIDFEAKQWIDALGTAPRITIAGHFDAKTAAGEIQPHWSQSLTTHSYAQADQFRSIIRGFAYYMIEQENKLRDEEIRQEDTYLFLEARYIRPDGKLSQVKATIVCAQIYSERQQYWEKVIERMFDLPLIGITPTEQINQNHAISLGEPDWIKGKGAEVAFIRANSSMTPHEKIAALRLMGMVIDRIREPMRCDTNA
jgi:hypothetical protein